MHVSDERPCLCYSAIFYLYLWVDHAKTLTSYASVCETLLGKWLSLFWRHRKNAIAAITHRFQTNVYILSLNIPSRTSRLTFSCVTSRNGDFEHCLLNASRFDWRNKLTTYLKSIDNWNVKLDAIRKNEKSNQSKVLDIRSDIRFVLTKRKIKTQ